MVERTSELLDSEHMLTDSNRLLHLVLDAIPVRVFWKDMNLKYLGCNRLLATNAEGGVALARSACPDMIMMDISLPGMSGTEAVAQLRQDAGFEAKPIIALSANAMERDIKAGIEAGFDAYLTKPLDISLLMNELQKAFGTVVVED